MKNIYKLIIIVFSISIVFMGCDKNPADPEYDKEIVVYGYLYGNEPLSEEHAITVFYSQPVYDYYDKSEAAIRNADVTITETGSGKTTVLVESATQPGYYYNDDLMIEPEKTYALNINTGDQQVSSVTTVPALLKMETDLSTTEVNTEYQTELGLRKPVYLEHKDPEQIIFIEMFCNETYENAEYIYPFSDSHNFPDDQEEYDGGKNSEPRRIWASMKLKDLESSDYDNKPVISWYNAMIVFFGSNTMQIAAIDENLQHYNYREHPELEGGIVGGIGLFGSLCGTNFELQIEKP